METYSHFSLPLKEKLSLGNVESILKHVRERIENGGECSLKEINTLPLCQYLLNEEEINQVINTLPLCQYLLNEEEINQVINTLPLCQYLLNEEEINQVNSLSLFTCKCLLLITIANSLDPDQAQQNVRPDLDPDCLTF